MYALIGFAGDQPEKDESRGDGGPQSEHVKGKTPDDVRRHRVAGQVPPHTLLLQDLGARLRVPQVQGSVHLNAVNCHYRFVTW